MTELRLEDSLAEVAADIQALENQRLGILAQIGEKALLELGEKPEYIELAAKAGETSLKIGDLKKKETALLAEKERRDREEKERLLKVTCFKCNTVNAEGSNFCEKCGERLGEPPREYCKGCGTMNHPGMKFCGECGAKLEAAAAE